MNNIKLDDLNVLNEETLMSPEELKDSVPASSQAMETVSGGRLAIKKILNRQDPRIFLIVGPCSIHDT
ncbi:MAG: 3-deoxy-7-phosphoheptulonate synthase, partial [Gammaproteobacteria bacterium]|nr:3-deoxy-7-phosphoheptulonate synthase [Gammaproteobacteria bacterium]